MARIPIICSGCHNSHTLNQKKFPLMLLKRIVDPDNTKRMMNVCVGFLCRKCSHKKTILDEIKKDSTLQGMGWRKAVKTFLDRKKPKYEF